MTNPTHCPPPSFSCSPHEAHANERVKNWTVMRGLLNSGSQGSCINKVLSTDVLTNHGEKTTPMTMIMADEYDSSVERITQYNPVRIRITGHKEPLTLDTIALSHPVILGMP